jgi:hypothetical protein
MISIVLSTSPKRIRQSVVLDERDATQTDFAVDQGERDRLEAATFARSINAQPRVDLEQRTVAAALEKLPVLAEELTTADVEPGSLMRAAIDVADLVVSSPDDHDRERPALAVRSDARQAEGLGAARLDVFSAANDEHVVGQHFCSPYLSRPLGIRSLPQRLSPRLAAQRLVPRRARADEIRTLVPYLEEAVQRGFVSSFGTVLRSLS